MSRVAVIGGGPAGMMAAVTAAGQGHEVSLWEKNEKTGKKLYITGKGRCNVTNNCDTEEFLQAVCVNRKFLYSAGYGFDSQAVMDFFEKQGLPLKTERGGRVFPASDHSADVIAALNRKLKESGVQVHLNQEVKEIFTAGDRVSGIRLKSGKSMEADAVIVATGGISYRSTGSTGDGYRFAREAGHQVTELYPSLVPLETAEDDPARMQGLSLRNIEVVFKDGKKELYRGFGEMMFTHFGVTGPLILTASTMIQKRLRDHPLQMMIDLKPALDFQQLDARILREFELGKNKHLKNILGALYPAKMVPVMMDRAQISPEKPVRDITKEERQRLVGLTKSFPLTITSLRDYNEAIITRGGVDVREIQPSTMESRLIKGLYFAGEVLDLDAVTGGYNLQIAWCTGYAAGMGVTAVQE